MSFSKLSTELDTKILEYLHDDRPSLTAMSMVSKYFRRITEPILYRDLCFPEMTTIQMKQLLTIVLLRPQLAKHVRSFTMVPKRRNPLDRTDNTPSKEEMEAWNNLHQANYPALFALSQKLKTFRLNPQFVQIWFIHILDCAFSHYLASRDPFLDPFLAVFLILTTNIETINLTATLGESLRKCRAILSIPWSGYPVDGTQQEKEPFNKLSDLCIAEDSFWENLYDRSFDVSIPSRVKRLRLPGWDMSALHMQGETMLALQHLDLRHVTVSPADLVQCLRTGQLANLRHLNLDGVEERVDPAHGGHLDITILSRGLAQHTPSLEVLEMRETAYSVVYCFNIGSLVELTRLHTLRIDIIHLVLAGGSGYDDPIDPHRILPASLRHLELTELQAEDVNQYCEEAGNDEIRPNHTQFIVNTVRTFSLLESLRIHVFIYGYNAPHRTISKVLSKASVDLLLGLERKGGERELEIGIHSLP
ncbi:hypothetical protein COCVIDRAFT_24478 [Bipolaris victoriae FI3]|uniref:F-box domain-containing protein n=1 Tax=Bipolaris victoriae (strain FI3) TaxID=930091 RepID=W7EGH3_BIPV3|nr:hypothetical protein COCVIDRAFT_24478 [Bipolaris victoriae FI3]